MNYYANDEERVRLIGGLRDLAEFLDGNPQVPAPRFTDLFVFPPAGSDAEMFAEIDVIAGQIGVTATDADIPSGHYSAVRDFGPVRYRAVAIPHSARNDSEGANSDAAGSHPRFRRPHRRETHGRPAPGGHRHPGAVTTASG